MKEDNNILKQIGHRDGMTVPDGYFADFAARMADSLPSTPFEASADGASTPSIKLSPWQRVRPYVYMAAMFAGVWCMLKLFTLLTSTSDKPWEPSPIMAEALGNEVFVNDYIINNIDEWDLMEDMVDEEGFDFSSLNDISDDPECYASDTVADDSNI